MGFPGAAFAREQDRAVQARGLGQVIQQFAELGIGAAELGGGGFFPGNRDGGRWLVFARLARLLEQAEEPLEFEGFRQVIRRTRAHGLHGGLGIVQTGEHDDRKRGEKMLILTRVWMPFMPGKSVIQNHRADRWAEQSRPLSPIRPPRGASRGLGRR
jgi:hypothetical protein